MPRGVQDAFGLPNRNDQIRTTRKAGEPLMQLIAKYVEFAVAAALDAVTTSLISGQRAEIRGFGTFKLNPHLCEHRQESEGKYFSGGRHVL